MKNKKRPSRKKSIILFTIIGIFLTVWSVLTFVPFQYGVRDYISVVGAIPFGKDLSGGSYMELSAVRPVDEDDAYTDTDAEYLDKLKSSVSILQKRFQTKGYIDSVVVLQKANDAYSIRAEIPKVDNASNVFKGLAIRGEVEFRYYDGRVIINGKDHVENVVPFYNRDGSPSVAFIFNEEGTKKISEATTIIAGYTENNQKVMPIFIDNVEKFKPSVSSALTDSSIVMTVTSFDEAENLAIVINSRALSVDVTAGDVKTLSPSFGIKAMTSLAIAAAVAIVLLIVGLIVFYKGFGVAASISFIFYSLLYLLGMIIVPNIQISMFGLAAIISAFVLMLSSHIVYFEKIKEEYKLGKTIPSAANTGFKRAVESIIDTHLIAFIASLLFMVIGNGKVTSFALIFALGVFLSAFVTIVITRMNIKLMFGLSSVSTKYYGVARENDNETEKECPIKKVKIDTDKSKKKILNVSAAIILSGILIFAVFGFNLGYDYNKNSSQVILTIGTELKNPDNEDSKFNEYSDEIVKVIKHYSISKGINISIDNVQYVGEDNNSGLAVKYKINGKVTHQQAITANNEIASSITEKFKDIIQENEQFNLNTDIYLFDGNENSIIPAMLAIAILIGIVFVYMVIRYNIFSLSAVLITILHDVLMLAALSAIIRFPISAGFISILIAISFISMVLNIVLFDRARENFRRLSLKDEHFTVIINKSVKETLIHRISIGTIALAILIPFLVINSAFRMYTIPLILGVAIALYSSTFVSSSLFVLFRKCRESAKDNKTVVKAKEKSLEKPVK